MLNLETTNWILAVMAVASVIQTLMLVGIAVVGARLYRQVSLTVEDLESRHVAPLRRQVDGVLTQVDDVLGEVHAIAARVSQQTARVDHAINGTIERVDETAEQLRHRVRDKVSKATGVVRGIRAVIASILTTEPASKPQAHARGTT
jgi:uncharacterized protein YoxC